MEPTFKYVKPVCRKKSERKHLDGHDCGLCKAYYDLLDLTPDQRKSRMKTVSRHKGDQRPKSPDNFWELEFPNEEECIKRGYCERNATPYKLKPLNENKYTRKM